MSRVLITIFSAIFLALSAVSAQAQSLIRDAELEQALKQLAAPVIRAAGLGPSRIRILVINDPSLNAFVVDSRHVFVHSGLIQRLERPEALQAVLAHEIAHIANGHLVLRAGSAQVANRISAIGFALAAAAAASGQGDAALGLAIGTSSSAQRVLFKHTRAQETSADQSGLRYMARAGIDPSGMSDVMELFRGQDLLRPGRQDPYVRTHPLSQDRLRAVNGYIAGLKAKGKPASDTTKYWFDRMNAKLQGFLGNPSFVLRQRNAKGNSEIATLRRAIAQHRKPNPKRAIAEVNRLLKMRPRDAYYHELRGQILLESGNAKAAVQSYQNAAKLAPSEPLIRAGLGRALIAVGSPAANKQALSVLEKARSQDPADPGMLRSLAVAYAKNRQPGMASVVTAERYTVLGRFKDALTHAERASKGLKRGSPGWLRAQDVLTTAERALR